MKMFTHIPDNPDIRKYISFIWELEGEHNANELILPNGVIELIFNLAEPIKAILPYRRVKEKAPDCFIQGIHTQVLNVSYSDQHHLFGVRLKPHAVQNFLGVLPSELNNEAIDLTLISSKFKRFWNQLGGARSFEDRVKLVEYFFKPVREQACLRTEMLSKWFLSVNLLARSPYYLEISPEDQQPPYSVNSLARKVSFSARHLNRKSKEIFGLTAEELIRYKKFLQAVELIHHEKYSLTEISYLAGFYDQSHFIRVFRSLSNMTPKKYLSMKSNLPFHLFA